VFFDEKYLNAYVHHKAQAMADGIDVGKALETILADPDIDALLLDTLTGSFNF